MTTWENVFDGYNVYDDVFTSHPEMYTEQANSGADFGLYDQFVKQLPYDLNFTFGVFYSSIIPITVIVSLIAIFFLPLFKRPQWL